MRLFVAGLAGVARLRLDPGEAADVVWATNAPEMYQLLVERRGWSLQLCQRFLADIWQRLLLAGEGPESSCAGRLVQPGS